MAVISCIVTVCQLLLVTNAVAQGPTRLEVYITGLNLLVAEPSRDSGSVNSVWVLSLRSDHKVGGAHAHPHKAQLRLGCEKNEMRPCLYSFDLNEVDLKLRGSLAGSLTLAANYKDVLSMDDLGYGSPKPGLLKPLSSATDLQEVSARWQLIGGTLDAWTVRKACVVYDIGPVAKPVVMRRKVFSVVKYTTSLSWGAKLIVVDHRTGKQVDEIDLHSRNPTLCTSVPCDPIQIWLVNEPPPYDPPIPPTFAHMAEIDRLTDNGLETNPNVPHEAPDQSLCPAPPSPAVGTTFCPDTRYP